MANCVLFRRVQSELGFQRCKIFAVGGAITRTEVYHYLMSLNIPMMNFYGMYMSLSPYTIECLFTWPYFFTSDQVAMIDLQYKWSPFTEMALKL